MNDSVQKNIRAAVGLADISVRNSKHKSSELQMNDFIQKIIRAAVGLADREGAGSACR